MHASLCVGVCICVCVYVYLYVCAWKCVRMIVSRGPTSSVNKTFVPPFSTCIVATHNVFENIFDKLIAGAYAYNAELPMSITRHSR